jgi:hypothetical protein
MAPQLEGLTAERRILISSDFEHKPVHSDRAYPALYTVVGFSQCFLDQLRQRVLFGINWNLVRSVAEHEEGSNWHIP